MLSKYGIIKTSKRRFLYFVSLDRNLCESVVKNFVCILWLWFLVSHPLSHRCPSVSSRIFHLSFHIQLKYMQILLLIWMKICASIQLGYGSRSFRFTSHDISISYTRDPVWPFLRLPILLMNFAHIRSVCCRMNMDIDWAQRNAGKTGANERMNEWVEIAVGVRRGCWEAWMIENRVENCLLIVCKLRQGILSNRDLLLNKMCLSPENHT